MNIDIQMGYIWAILIEILFKPISASCFNQYLAPQNTSLSITTQAFTLYNSIPYKTKTRNIAQLKHPSFQISPECIYYSVSLSSTTCIISLPDMFDSLINNGVQNDPPNRV